MGKKSNGQLRRQRFVERALRKGVDVTQPHDTGGYAYMYGTDGSTLRTGGVYEVRPAMRRTFVQG